MTEENRWFQVNCRQYAKLPSVHFVMNGEDFSIESKYYVQRVCNCIRE